MADENYWKNYWPARNGQAPEDPNSLGAEHGYRDAQPNKTPANGSSSAGDTGSGYTFNTEGNAGLGIVAIFVFAAVYEFTATAINNIDLIAAGAVGFGGTITVAKKWGALETIRGKIATYAIAAAIATSAVAITGTQIRKIGYDVGLPNITNFSKDISLWGKPVNASSDTFQKMAKTFGHLAVARYKALEQQIIFMPNKLSGMSCNNNACTSNELAIERTDYYGQEPATLEDFNTNGISTNSGSVSVRQEFIAYNKNRRRGSWSDDLHITLSVKFSVDSYLLGLFKSLNEHIELEIRNRYSDFRPTIVEFSQASDSSSLSSCSHDAYMKAYQPSEKYYHQSFKDPKHLTNLPAKGGYASLKPMGDLYAASFNNYVFDSPDGSYMMCFNEKGQIIDLDVHLKRPIDIEGRPTKPAWWSFLPSF